MSAAMLAVMAKFERDGSPKAAEARPRADSVSRVQEDAWRRRDDRIRAITASWTERVEAEAAAAKARRATA
eukprot:CAMPEP_0119270718 /NCGR_PEP_ID=MMETSP1329-20130426/7613_1 /TAXON_ID=114041 /ORGANISM="Genus nov. species nov., Strain RCC1024" /LENGTH=70 /DNA_ID=CAMNT_0007270749 /DNA_START=114 /DNA_END=322 /DNA_ORIENTATION=-